jgi:hypothetical protein
MNITLKMIWGGHFWAYCRAGLSSSVTRRFHESVRRVGTARERHDDLERWRVHGIFHCNVSLMPVSISARWEIDRCRGTLFFASSSHSDNAVNIVRVVGFA